VVFFPIVEGAESFVGLIVCIPPLSETHHVLHNESKRILPIVLLNQVNHGYDTIQSLGGLARSNFDVEIYGPSPRKTSIPLSDKIDVEL